jgi:phospholipase A2
VSHFASFSDWVEFSPNEVSIPKYGISVDSKLFCSKFYRGRLVKEEKEPPLSYLQGIWGSAYTILLNRVFNTNTQHDEKKEIGTFDPFEHRFP